MAWTEAQLKDAARKAMAAGDTAAAKRLIGEARKVSGQQPAQTRPVPAGMTPEQFAYQQQRAAGQTPAPIAVTEDRAAEQAAIDAPVEAETRREMYDPGKLATSVLSGAQGMTFGTSDEIVAGLMSLSPDMTYDQALENTRALISQGKEFNPKTALTSEIAGAVMVPGAGGAGVAAKGATLGTKAARGALAGATTGAAYGFGTGEGGLGNRLESATNSAVMGGALGAAAPALGALVRNVGQRVADSSAGKAALKLAPSADELRAMAGKIFDKADQTGMPRGELTAAFPGMQAGAVRAGMDDILTPQSARAVGRIEDAATAPGATMGFRDLDILRRQAQIPAGSTTMPVEAAIGSKLVSGLDDVLEKAAPGTAKEVADARAMWGQLRRSEKVEEAIRKAELHPSGFAQGIMTEFRTILRDPKKLRGFSEQEKRVMGNLVNKISPQSLLSVVGKFGPRMSGNGNVVGTATGTGLGALMGGPIGMAAVPALGTAARVIGDKSAAKKADIVRALVAMGGNAPQAGTAIPKGMEKIVQQLMLGIAPASQSLTDMQAIQR